MKHKSEFGKGLVICLSKFYQHFGTDSISRIYFYTKMMKLSEEDRQEVISDNPPSRLDYGREMNSMFKFFYTKEIPICGSYEEALSSQITLWANGASDHLYEIIVPKGKEWNEIRTLAKELQNKGLDMGHGSGLLGKTSFTLKDLEYLRELTEKILLLVDLKLGLKADWGSY